MTTLDDRPDIGGAEATAPAPDQPPARTEVSFDTSPDRYKHWTLSVDGEVATLTLDVAEDGGIVPGYELKMNSYDLGVDIELHDAVQRIRFEHPEVKAVVMTSAKERMFCAGANIRMLAASPHSWKVNFCKFTNETRNGIEDSSANSGLTFIAACNGTAAGGGYELALACDQIVLVDDNSSAVSLPEVPLLGVLPGTGGTQRLARLVGRSKAIELMVTGRTFSFEEAESLGIVNAVLPKDEWWENVVLYAQQFVTPNKASMAVGHIKRSVISGLEIPQEYGLALERELQNLLFKSSDAKEGLAAYVEKRQPTFTGR